MNRRAVPLQVDTPVPGVENADALPRPDFLPELIPTVAYRLFVAVLLLVVSVYIARLAREVLGRRVARRFKRPSVSRTILRGIQAGIIGLAALTSLGFLGLGLGNLALSVGVFSAVVGIILAPIIGNVLSGVFILNEQPYEIGDMIELDDTETTGFVEDITLLYTKIFTLDNTFIVMPNGTMRERDVINYSAEDTRIRMTLDVGVTYESDITVARDQMEAAAREVDGVIQGGPDIRVGSARYPASPSCYIQSFGDSEVALRLRYWASEPYKQTTLRSKVLTNVWRRFDEKGIEIPYPHSHMVFDDTSGELQVAMRESDQAAESTQSGATRRDAENVEQPDGETKPADGPDDRPPEGGATDSQ